MTPTPEGSRPGARVLVTGATGLVGAHAVRALLAAGMRVRALVRAPDARVEGAELFQGDLERPASLAGACDGVELVLHAAARLEGDREALERANTLGTRALLAQARAAGVRRFVLTSSSAVYRDGPLVRAPEEHPRGGGSDYARSKIAAEDAVLAARGLAVLVLRLPTVYGPGDRHFLPALASAVRSCAIPTTAEGGALRDVLHAADVARGLRLALAAPLAGPTVWNLAGARPARTAELARAAARALGQEALLFTVPGDLPLDAPGPLWEALVRGLPRPPLPWPLVPAALVERTLDGRRARAALGWEAETGLEPGVREALRLA